MSAQRDTEFFNSSREVVKDIPDEAKLLVGGIPLPFLSPSPSLSPFPHLPPPPPSLLSPLPLSHNSTILSSPLPFLTHTHTKQGLVYVVSQKT